MREFQGTGARLVRLAPAKIEEIARDNLEIEPDGEMTGEKRTTNDLLHFLSQFHKVDCAEISLRSILSDFSFRYGL